MAKMQVPVGDIATLPAWSAEGEICGEGCGLGMVGVVVVAAIGGCVARQYASRYSAMCSHASSSWFSSSITSNISGGHWASFSAATICTLRFLACDFPRDFINLCRTCKGQKKVQIRLTIWY